MRNEKDVRVRRTREKKSLTLPKMERGFNTVYTQFVRCGRANCRCAQGWLHGPYFYRFYRVNGRLRKQYIRRADEAEASKLCFNRRSVRRKLEALRQSELDGLYSWRQMVDEMHEVLSSLPDHKPQAKKEGEA